MTTPNTTKSKDYSLDPKHLSLEAKKLMLVVLVPSRFTEHSVGALQKSDIEKAYRDSYDALLRNLDGETSDYLTMLVDISEKLSRREESPSKLLKALDANNAKHPVFAKRYSYYASRLHDRLVLRDEEGRYGALTKTI